MKPHLTRMPGLIVGYDNDRHGFVYLHEWSCYDDVTEFEGHGETQAEAWQNWFKQLPIWRQIVWVITNRFGSN